MLRNGELAPEVAVQLLGNTVPVKAAGGVQEGAQKRPLETNEGSGGGADHSTNKAESGELDSSLDDVLNQAKKARLETLLNL